MPEKSCYPMIFYPGFLWMTYSPAKPLRKLYFPGSKTGRGRLKRCPQAGNLLSQSGMVYADFIRPDEPHQRNRGLSARVPFADYRIIEYLWNVPWEMKAKDGIVNLLRQAGRGKLPDEVLFRKSLLTPKSMTVLMKPC